MCPLVPMFTCGFDRSNFALAIPVSCRGLARTGPRSALAGYLRHDLFGDVPGDFLVAGELHGVGGPPLGHGADVGGVSEHLAERDVGADDLGIAPAVHDDDAPASAVEVADDRALVLRRHDDLDVHHGLEEHGLGLATAFLEAHGRGDLEGHLVRVDVVIAAVGQRHLDVDHGVAGEHPGLRRLLDALLDRGHVLARDGGAPELVLEDDARAGLGRLDLEPDVAVLAPATRLPDEAPLRLGLLADGFAVGDLRLAYVGVDFELAQQPVDDDLEVELSHPVDQRLIGLRVHVDLEGRVFHGEARQRLAELLIVGLGLGLDRHRDDRGGEVHRLQHDRLVGIAQRVARPRVLEAHDGGDVAGRDRLDLLALVGVHADQTPDALLLVARRVVDAGAGLERPGIHPHEGELAHEGVVHDLEGEGGERRLAVGRARLVQPRFRIDPVQRRYVERRRKIVHHGVEHGLDTLVLERRATDHREELHRDRARPHRRLDLLGADLLTGQILLHQVIVHLGQRLDHLLAVLGGLLLDVGGDVDGLVGLPEVFAVRPDIGDLLDEIDHAPELVLTADRDLDRHRVGAQAVLQHGEAAEVVGADAVHLVDVDDAGHLVLVRLPPHGLRLWLDARDGVQDGDGAVEDPQRALDLHGEVDVAGRIDDVDAAVPPEGGGRGGRDGDPALLLLHHPVHGGGALVHLADLVRSAGVVEHPFRGGGLAGIDVSHDADVPGFLERVLLFHDAAFPSARRYSREEGGRGSGPPLRISVATSDSARTPCWPPPSCECLRAS